MDRLTVAYQAALRHTRESVSDLVGTDFMRLSAYRDSNIAPFLSKALPLVLAGQKRAVSLTSLYLSRKMDTSLVGLSADGLIGADVRNGVDPAIVYARPFVSVWTALSKNSTFEDAVAAGFARLTSTVEMDIAMSARDSMVAYSAQDERIVAWVRVAEGGCCDYCQMLDGVRTGPAEPQPLHNRCGCTAEPITRSFSHDAAMNEAMAAGWSKSDVMIEDHGEMGPMITRKGETFTSEADLGEGDN